MYYLIIFTLFVCPALSQYAFNTGMRADLTFDDRNDRFDVSDIIKSHKKLFRAQPIDPQTSDETTYRRTGNDFRSSNYRRYRRYKPSRKSKPLSKTRKELLNQIKRERTEQLNRILNDALLRIHNSRRDFAYHDDMISNDDNEEDFNTNLNKFRANVKETSDKFEDVEGVLSNLVVNGRRNLGEDDQFLMHYAFPVNMRIEGYLQSPQEEI